jgi:fluoride exporter
MSASFPWLSLAAVAFGSALGGVLRWLVQQGLNARWAAFPLGTLVVNCVGGLLIGMALAWFIRSPNETLRLLWVTGFLGGLTTFSAFTGESLTLLQRGDIGWALAHSGAHVVGSLASCAVGFRVAKALLG